jgi:hypothetical protein
MLGKFDRQLHNILTVQASENGSAEEPTATTGTKPEIKE